ncbi:tetratricopeptide repeat protein [Vibrio owensii]|uniref:tetratricopeptide repeat protein n=1 Tax=Vibrio harveyi group TaxID=717610 RepID=UPI003CC607F6
MKFRKLLVAMLAVAPMLASATALDWKVEEIDPYAVREAQIVKLNANIKDAGGFVRLKDDAKLGDGNSSYILGEMYRLGIVYDIDFDKALQHFSDGVELNHPESLLRMGQYLMGHDPLMPLSDDYDSEDIQKAYFQGFKMIEDSAFLGLADAQYFLGLHYIEGEIKYRDRDLGMFWLGKAYSQGHMQAEKARAEYKRQSDYEKDFDHVQRMATYGDTNAMVRLADFYLNDWKVGEDKPKAMRLLITAAKLGNHDAIAKLNELGVSEY